MLRLIRRAAQNEDGQTILEYGLVISLVSVASIAILGIFEVGLSGYWNDVTTALTNALT